LDTLDISRHCVGGAHLFRLGAIVLRRVAPHTEVVIPVTRSAVSAAYPDNDGSAAGAKLAHWVRSIPNSRLIGGTYESPFYNGFCIPKVRLSYEPS
jgi:hypothetical protein